MGAPSPQGSATLAGESFESPEVRVFAWPAMYSTEEALGPLGAYSRYVVLDIAHRERLFAQRAHDIDRDVARSLTCQCLSVLVVARRAAVSGLSPRG